MFTGIIEETGIVRSIGRTAASIHLMIQASLGSRNLRPGDSLAVNGCCLTVVKVASRSRSRFMQFDLLRETWERTNLQFARTGSLVNLERALRADGRLGGHFVTGHVDGIGRIVSWERAGSDHLLDVEAPPDIMRYLVVKGSIAVDGISLTIAAVQKKLFRLWIIPHTYKVTALRKRAVGDAVNLETDLLGKYVEKFLTSLQEH